MTKFYIIPVIKATSGKYIKRHPVGTFSNMRNNSAGNCFREHALTRAYCVAWMVASGADEGKLCKGQGL
ncbi:MAG: hypothetical protein JWP37_3545 [Mucilaginibacter sp.]|nr:hypothetical protein [Mucilaginibacter sp.]